MAASAKQPARKTGLSLYANLLDSSNASSDSAIISKAPVVFSQAGGEDGAEEASDRKHINAGRDIFLPFQRPDVLCSRKKNAMAHIFSLNCGGVLLNSGAPIPAYEETATGGTEGKGKGPGGTKDSFGGE